MIQLKLDEKRTTDHKMKLEGTLIIENGQLALVQYNDFEEIVRLKYLDDALKNFIDKDVKLAIADADKEEETIDHSTDYLD